MIDFDYSNNNSSLPPTLNEAGSTEPITEPTTVKKDTLSPKLLVAFITILASISLIFAVGNWFDSLKTGFAIKEDVDLEALSSNALTNSDVANILKLQNQDTDLDGLTDYDELYVYKTSVYLPDSDSDGFSDAVEIGNNEDPNCPVGQDCGLSIPAQPTAELGNISAEEIRQLLLEQGAMSQEELDKIDDATLQQLYLETLSETEQAQTGFEELQPAQNLDSLTPEQLRSLLIEQGISSAELNAVSDEELMQLWQETVQEQATTP